MKQGKVKILIADDTPANIKIIEKFIERRGFEVIVAENGEEALKKYQSEKPDLVLMDIMMPKMDGYEATAKIRELDRDNWIPIIFLSAKTTVEDQIKGLEVGGDDYLSKPVDLRMLEAKLAAVLRVVNMQRELAFTSDKLLDFAKQNSEEMELAKRLMNNMLQKYADESMLNVRMSNEAAENISGDICITQLADNNKLYVLLADATGHGLSAAISMIPLTQVFYKMAADGFGIASIAKTINGKLKELLPIDRFVAATIASIDYNNQCIELWNGSNPTPMMVNQKGAVIKRFEQSNFALGIVDNKDFSSKTEVYMFNDACELIIFSDGLSDQINQANESFGIERVKAAMSKINPEESKYQTAYDALLTELMEFKKNCKQQDDISLMSVLCGSDMLNT